jgi:tetratricopeptide (TPR) repeat protein
MFIRKIVCFLLLIFVISAPCLAQDTLSFFLKSNIADTLKCDALNRLARSYISEQKYSKAASLIGKSEEIALRTNYKKGQARIFTLKGIINGDEGNTVSAIDFFQKSIKLKNELGDYSGIANNYTDIGRLYFDQGNYGLALEKYFQSMQNATRANNLIFVAYAQNNIANAYCELKDFNSAIKYYNLCKPQFESAKDIFALVATLNGLGLSNAGMNRLEEATKYYQEGIFLSKELDATEWTCNLQNNLGVVYQRQKKYADAETLHNEALQSSKESGLALAYATAVLNLGNINAMMRNFKLAENYYTEGLLMAKKFHAYEMAANVYLELYKIDSAQNKFNDGLIKIQLAKAFKDSFVNEINVQKASMAQVQYELESRSIADSLRRNLAAEKEKYIRSEELKRRKIYTYSSAFAAAIVLIFVFIVVRTYRINRRATAILALQKERIEEKQKNILDSIQYARRIQKALITNDSAFLKYITRTKTNVHE